MKTLKQLADELGIKKQTLYTRLKKLDKNNAGEALINKQGNKFYLTDYGINQLIHDLQNNPIQSENRASGFKNQTYKDDLQTNINDQTNDLKANINDYEHSQTFINDLQTNMNDLEVDRLKEENTQLKIDNAILLKEVELLKDRLQEKDRIIEDIKDQRRDLSDKISDLINSLENSQKLISQSHYIQALDKPLKEADEDVVDLQNDKEVKPEKKKKLKKKKKRKNKKTKQGKTGFAGIKR